MRLLPININRILLVIYLLLTLASMINLRESAAASASTECGSLADYGSVVFDFSKQQNVKSKTIWVKSKSEQLSSHGLVVKVDGQCLSLSSDNTSDWTWSVLEEQGEPYLISSSHFLKNAIELIGVQDGVMVDKVILADDGCRPVGDGDNCYIDTGATIIDHFGYVRLNSSKTQITGLARVSETPWQKSNDVIAVSYIVDGKIIQRSDHASDFDTSLLANGEHELYIETLLTDGGVIKELVGVSVYNPQTFLSPVIRWVKLNREQAIIASVGFIASLTIIAAIGFVRKRSITSSQRKLRGLDFSLK